MLAVTAVPIMEESNDRDDEIIPFVAVGVECTKFSMNDRLDHWHSVKESVSFGADTSSTEISGCK